MKTITSLALAALTISAANATIFGFAAPLINGAQEIPANNSSVFGSGSFTLDDTTWTLSGSFSLSNAANFAYTGNHIHIAPTVTPRSNGPVRFDILPVTYFNQAFGNNRLIGWTGVKTGTTAEKQQFLADLIAGKGYFNFHTSAFPGGEIRGDIHCSSVPEPSVWLALGLGATVLLRKRSK